MSEFDRMNENDIEKLKRENERLKTCLAELAEATIDAVDLCVGCCSDIYNDDDMDHCKTCINKKTVELAYAVKSLLGVK
jgi:hypothetical protein